MKQLNYILLFIYFSLSSFTTFGQIPDLEIWEIQGDDLTSPYEDSLVTTSLNIVTLVDEDRFFIQTPPERTDNNFLTSDGIMVYVGSPFSLEVGDLVNVTGRIQEYYDLTEFGPDELSFTVDSTEVVLPLPFILSDTIPSTQFELLPSLEKLEGMRVGFENATSTGPSNDDIGTMTFQEFRPFREAGIQPPGVFGLPAWDGNPEVIRIDMENVSSIALSSNMNLTGRGVLSYSNGIYEIVSDEIEVQGDPTLYAVRNKNNTEATIGSLNCFVFSNIESDFSTRNLKIANYIIDLLKAPDILAVQEVRNLNTLQSLADKIKEINPEIEYEAYLLGGSENGGFQINNGFLVRNTIQDVQVTQWAQDEVLSLGGFLHDRPPLLLEAKFTTNPPTPIKVLNLHLRSLGGIEGNNANYVKTKRWEQSISVANIIRDLQYENLVVVGDYNAFQFSDGYVDVLAQLTGQPSLGAEFEVLDIVELPLTNHSLSTSLDQRYSYVFRGNAQILDHCISTELEDLEINELQYARGNSDNSNAYLDDTSVLYRASDHDGFVLYLGLNDSLSVGTNDLTEQSFSVDFPNPFKNNSILLFELKKNGFLNLDLYDSSGKLVYSKNWKNLAAGKHSFSPNWNLAKGIYFLSLKNEQSVLTEKLFVE